MGASAQIGLDIRMTAKSDRIKALIEDPDLKQAFTDVREKYRDLIEETPVSDATALLDIRKMLHALREVEKHLHQAIQDGHLEDFRAQEDRHPFLGDLRWKKQH